MNTVNLDKTATSDFLMEWAAGISDCSFSLQLIRQELLEADSLSRQCSVVNLVIDRLEWIQKNINIFDTEKL